MAGTPEGVLEGSDRELVVKKKFHFKTHEMKEEQKKPGFPNALCPKNLPLFKDTTTSQWSCQRGRA